MVGFSFPPAFLGRNKPLELYLTLRPGWDFTVKDLTDFCFPSKETRGKKEKKTRLVYEKEVSIPKETSIEPCCGFD